MTTTLTFPAPSAPATPRHRALRRHPRTDRKIERISASWLDVDRRVAGLVAGLADEAVVEGGGELVAGRFSYVAIDQSHRDVVVAPGTSAFTAVCPTSVLVIPTDRMNEVADLVPAVAEAWTGRPSTEAEHRR